MATYGGKSLKRLVAISVTISGCALTGMILIRVLQPGSIGLTLCVFVFGLGTALGYMNVNWNAAHARLEVCEGGVRLLLLGGITWEGNWAPGKVEVPWDRIRKVEVGHFRKVRFAPLEHVVIRTTDGKDAEMPFYFLEAAETKHFTTVVRKFVEDVEVDVDFN